MLIMRLIESGVVNFATGIAGNPGFFKVSICNFSSSFLLPRYHNIALAERNVFETSTEGVRREQAF